MEVTKEGLRADLSDASWRKSSKSGPYSDNCVEFTQVGDLVGLRDSKNPTGPALMFTPGEWTAFLEGAKDGEFELQ